jgi:Domain of unknown function (DUF4276)
LTLVRVGCIVAGRGETDAIRVLFRRIAQMETPEKEVEFVTVLRVPEDRLLKDGELERHVTLVGRKLAGNGKILILIDRDDGCPAKLGPEMVRRAKSARSDLSISVVIAKREFEAWFLAAAESLRGVRHLPKDLSAPATPEEIRDAKGWLTQRMLDGYGYSPSVDQAALTAQMDINTARRADSFDKCFREIRRILVE